MYKIITLLTLCSAITVNQVHASLTSIRDYIENHPKSTAAVAITSILLYKYHKTYATPKSTVIPVSITDLKNHQSEQLQALPLSLTSNDVITRLYRWTDIPCILKAPENNDLPTDPTVFKTLCEKQKLVSSDYLYDLKPWNDEKWQQVLQYLTKQTHEPNIPYKAASKLPIDHIPTILHDAQIILKAFIPKTGIAHLDRKQNFKIKRKRVLDRLFTYAQLQQVIDKKGLSHVHLPLKLLVAQHKKTREYNTDPTLISSLINNRLQIRLTPTLETQLRINEDDHYTLVLFAEKKPTCTVPLTKDTEHDLCTLIEEAPFDVGDVQYGNNIFSDQHGDAIIIDTEYKGATKQSSLSQLNKIAHTTLIS